MSFENRNGYLRHEVIPNPRFTGYSQMLRLKRFHLKYMTTQCAEQRGRICEVSARRMVALAPLEGLLMDELRV
jgi:hypothetical protein